MRSILILAVWLQSMPTMAAPITLDKTQATTGARLDPGTGVCGTVTHFGTPAMPVTTVMAATAILDKPSNDPMILSRLPRIMDTINFANSDPAAVGDFTSPNYPDALFPFGSPQAMPAGDGNNIAMRLRGYLNVTSQKSGMPITFAVNCDDLCALTIGKTPVIPLADARLSSRIAKQVLFADPGLYPIELVYVQNASAAFLELSWALSAEAEGAIGSPLDMSKFQPIPTSTLFNASIGRSPVCQECGAAGQVCPQMYYCSDNLCQACLVPDHCGPTCQTCPASARLCSAGQCVECLDDSTCMAGQACKNGFCQACTAATTCPTGTYCNLTLGHCVSSALSCASAVECPPDQTCDLTSHLCMQAPKGCQADADCPQASACNHATGTCDMLTQASGCTTTSAEGTAGSAWALLSGLLGIALVKRRRPRERCATSRT